MDFKNTVQSERFVQKKEDKEFEFKKDMILYPSCSRETKYRMIALSYFENPKKDKDGKVDARWMPMTTISVPSLARKVKSAKYPYFNKYNQRSEYTSDKIQRCILTDEVNADKGKTSEDGKPLPLSQIHSRSYELTEVFYILDIEIDGKTYEINDYALVNMSAKDVHWSTKQAVGESFGKFLGKGITKTHILEYEASSSGSHSLSKDEKIPKDLLPKIEELRSKDLRSEFADLLPYEYADFYEFTVGKKFIDDNYQRNMVNKGITPNFALSEERISELKEIFAGSGLRGALSSSPEVAVEEETEEIPF